jgi:hypothetical protein
VSGQRDGERWPAGRLLAEWTRCRSIRRLLIALNEGGVDLRLLVPAVLDLQPRRGRDWARARKLLRERVERLETPYEAIMELVQLLGAGGEAATVLVVLRLWPAPPPTVALVPGKLEGTSRTSGFSARLWPCRAARLGGDPD